MKRLLDHRRCTSHFCGFLVRHSAVQFVTLRFIVLSFPFLREHTTPPPNKPSRSVDATAHSGVSEVAVDSRFAWTDLGGGQSLQQVFHPP